nr:MAG TPA: hypothetical protein [Caudoviricetes sp.]
MLIDYSFVDIIFICKKDRLTKTPLYTILSYVKGGTSHGITS